MQNTQAAQNTAAAIIPERLPELIRAGQLAVKYAELARAAAQARAAYVAAREYWRGELFDGAHVPAESKEWRQLMTVTDPEYATRCAAEQDARNALRRLKAAASKFLRPMPRIDPMPFADPRDDDYEYTDLMPHTTAAAHG